jgi:hypothetical protein
LLKTGKFETLEDKKQSETDATEDVAEAKPTVKSKKTTAKKTTAKKPAAKKPAAKKKD